MILLTDLAPFWTTSRAAGIGALLCASPSLSAGPLMALDPTSIPLT